MIEIDKDTFMDIIAKTDCRLIVEGRFPYTTIFVDKKTNKEIGREVESWHDGIEHKYPIICKCYISEEYYDRSK